jgi:hypothetical protein
MPLIEKKTAQLPGVLDLNPLAASNQLVDIGTRRPWRIALLIKRLSLTLILDLTDSITLGRQKLENDASTFISLQAFGAEDDGVSRQHLLLKLDGSAVTIEDLNSTNGTFLNEARLEPHTAYPIRHKDELRLGRMEMQIELLTDPMN